MLYPGGENYELSGFGCDINGGIGCHPGLAGICVTGVVGPEESVDAVALGHAHVTTVQIIDSRPRRVGVYVHIVVPTIARDVAPRFVELHYHAHALWPMSAAGMHCGFKHALFGPCGPGHHSRMLLFAEIKSAFVQSSLGVGRHTAVAVGLL